MTEKTRTGAEVLLELEKKLDIALGIIRTQDMNIKILSNKLNTVLETLEKKPVEAPKITVEAIAQKFPTQIQVPEDKNIVVNSESTLPLETEPKGFRRTSRPETFAGDDAYLEKPSGAVTPKYPVQIPNAPQGFPPPPGRGPNTPPPGRESVAQVPPAPQPQPPKAETKPKETHKQNVVMLQNAVPVQQRVVNAHGKSLFLADVEVIDLSTMQSVTKTRTNGTGKWMASLGVGQYRVIIRKLEAATKERLEVTQDIEVDGSVSPLELQTVIIKA